MTLYRCSRKFLGRFLGIYLIAAATVIALMGLAAFLTKESALLVLGLLAGGLVAANGIAVWFARRTYRFTISSDAIRTEKMFTKDIDVLTPLVHIQGVSAYEGIVEALCDVGTVEISTASSNGEHATFRWPHLEHHRAVAEGLRTVMEAARRRT